MRALIGRWRTAFGFLLLLLLWEVGVHLFRVRAYILPPPSEVLVALAKNWKPVATGAGTTSLEIIAGYALAIDSQHSARRRHRRSRASMEEAVYPVVVFFQIVPKIAVAPLFIIWFGFGFTPKLLLVFLLSFFPIVIASIAGFSSINPEIIDFVKTTGADRLRAFFKVRLPHALPEIFTGLKVGAALSATAAVVAEFVASDRGLGYLLLQYNGDLNTQMVFATIIVLSAIGVAIYFAGNCWSGSGHSLARLAE